jgi:excinuclease ABC subunit A
VDRPDVDAIDGLPPAIAIQQKGTITSGRSTVGTATEIYDYLRLLYARIGGPCAGSGGREVVEESAERVVDRILERGEGRLTIGFPLDPSRCWAR